MVGDGRKFLTALLTLDPEVAGGATVDDASIQSAVHEAVARVNEKHSHTEGIRRWRLLPQDLSVAGIEKTIGDFGKRAKEGALKMDEMKGGTFTISNGGVFGSLMSTPIINPPQSAVLGLHRIEDRPVVVNGQVVVRPMMYLALSYDHRIVDGQGAVTFLVHVKEAIEDPQRLLLDL